MDPLDQVKGFFNLLLAPLDNKGLCAFTAPDAPTRDKGGFDPGKPSERLNFRDNLKGCQRNQTRRITHCVIQPQLAHFF